MKQLSFRDPLSKVYSAEEGILRRLDSKSKFFFEELFSESFFQNLELSKLVQKSNFLKKNGEDFIQHERIENFTEVNEMSSYQLYLCGLHTIKLMIKSLEYNYQIKDASAWNVVIFRGKPIFLDVASFEKWNGEKTWTAYGQYIRHFIIPLLINKEMGISTSKLFLINRDGVDPLEAFKLLGMKSYKSFIGFEFVILPYFLRSAKIKKKNNFKSDFEFNKKILINILNRLKNKIKKLEPDTKSFWSRYTLNRKHYSNMDIEIKKKIIEDFFKENKGKVLDIGCNTGEFLEIASKYNEEVHGIDIDENCINFIQKNIQKKGINVSNVNIANPVSPAGWENSETQGFLKKNRDYYDHVLFLGIVHHLTVSERIPLSNILSLLSSLTKKNIIFEFVSNNDEKFIQIAGINIDLYNYFTKEYFENLVIKFFKIKKIYNLESNLNRHIYLLEKLY